MTYQEQPQSRVPQATGGAAADSHGSRELNGASVAERFGEAPCEAPGERRTSRTTSRAHTCRASASITTANWARRGGEKSRQHLATCHTCAEALAFFGRVSGAFSATAPEPLEPASRERLRSLVAPQAVPDLTPGAVFRGVPAHVRWVRRLTAVAAVLFVVAVCRLAFQRYSATGWTRRPPINRIRAPPPTG